jgi:hypothetical protein
MGLRKNKRTKEKKAISNTLTSIATIGSKGRVIFKIICPYDITIQNFKQHKNFNWLD